MSDGHNRLLSEQRHRWSKTLVLALTTLVAACGDGSTEPPADGVFGEWLRSSGEVRTYELRLPGSYDGSLPTPLLIALHGNPDNGAGFEARSGLTPAADRAGFITVYPDGLEGTWGPWDNQLMLDLIEHLSEELLIDRNRVYIAGYSAGGTRTQIVVCAHSGVFAAAVSVGATLERDVYANCELRNPTPTLFVHGTEDTAFPWDGLTLGSRRRFSVDGTLERWTQLNDCTGEAVSDTLPDRVDDGTRVWSERWTDCGDDAEVMLYGIEGGGHTWPSGPGPFPPGRTTQEISSDDILDFLARH